MSEFMIIDRGLNMYHTKQCEVTLQVNEFLLTEGIFRTQSKIQDGAIWKNNYSLNYFLQKTQS